MTGCIYRIAVAPVRPVGTWTCNHGSQIQLYARIGRDGYGPRQREWWFPSQMVPCQACSAVATLLRGLAARCSPACDPSQPRASGLRFGIEVLVLFQSQSQRRKGLGAVGPGDQGIIVGMRMCQKEASLYGFVVHVRSMRREVDESAGGNGKKNKGAAQPAACGAPRRMFR